MAERKLPTRVRFKHGAYYFVDKDDKWHHLGYTMAQMYEGLRQFNIQPAKERDPRFMAALFDRYEQEIIPKKAPRTQADNHKELARLRHAFGAQPIAAITPYMVGRYLDVRGAEAPVRANREKALLSHVFTMAMRWGLTHYNPCRGVHRNPEKKRRRYVEREEFLAVYRRAEPIVQIVMDLCYMTLQRVSDVIGIRLSQLREDGILFEPSKTRERTAVRVLIEWTPELRAVVARAKALRQVQSATHLLCTRRGTPCTYDGISAMFRRYVDKAHAAGEITEKFRLQDLRPKAATDSERAGRNPQRGLGHATRQMTDHYIQSREVERFTAMPKIN